MQILVPVLAVLLAAVPVAASAQAPSLPETSRAQQQVNDLSRSINGQQRVLQQSQQNQFETNQLRGEIQRQNTVPPIGCGPGAIRC